MLGFFLRSLELNCFLLVENWFCDSALWLRNKCKFSPNETNIPRWALDTLVGPDLFSIFKIDLGNIFMGECQDNYNSVFYNNYSFASNLSCLEFWAEVYNGRPWWSQELVTGPSPLSSILVEPYPQDHRPWMHGM